MSEPNKYITKEEMTDLIDSELEEFRDLLIEGFSVASHDYSLRTRWAKGEVDYFNDHEPDPEWTDAEDTLYDLHRRSHLLLRDIMREMNKLEYEKTKKLSVYEIDKEMIALEEQEWDEYFATLWSEEG